MTNSHLKVIQVGLMTETFMNCWFAVARCDHAFEQLLKSAAKNAAYTSHRTQNYFIKFIDKYISEKLTKRITEEKYFSVIADENTDSQRKEQLSTGVYYADGNRISFHWLLGNQ